MTVTPFSSKRPRRAAAAVTRSLPEPPWALPPPVVPPAEQPAAGRASRAASRAAAGRRRGLTGPTS
ncbi:hypothetical protein ACFQ0M_12375 [Kitasatospora aburaviensis]